MKKTLKRTLAIVMAVAMLCALSVSVFAAGSASLQIVLPSGALTAVNYSIPDDGATVYDAVVDKYAAYNLTWETVPDWYDPEVTWEALTGMTINGITYETRAMTASERTTYNVPTATWSNNPNYAGYGLISVDNGVYTYIYAGFDWTYKVNNQNMYSYMEDVDINSNDNVVLTYSAQITTWPQNYAIPDFILP